MSGFLDYKDVKNVVIYCFLGVISLATYIYKADQAVLENNHIALVAKHKEKENDLIGRFERLQRSLESRMNRHYYGLKDTITELKTGQKEMRLEQKTLAIDLATLKAKQQ